MSTNLWARDLEDLEDTFRAMVARGALRPTRWQRWVHRVRVFFFGLED